METLNSTKSLTATSTSKPAPLLPRKASAMVWNVLLRPFLKNNKRNEHSDSVFKQSIAISKHLCVLPYVDKRGSCTFHVTPTLPNASHKYYLLLSTLSNK